MKKTSKSYWMKGTLIILVLLLQTSPGMACPTNQELLKRCQCESTINGVVLECSGSNFGETLALLRASRSQLGLIQELHFQNSSILRIPPNLFQGLFIKQLDLGNNFIQVIEPDTFQGLQNVLQDLNLAGNRLLQVPTVSLSGMSNLRQLDLSKNQITNLGPEILRTVPKLFNLDLAENQICDIDQNAFLHLKHSLQTLNLGRNCMPAVPASAVRGFQQLLALHLHENRIQSLGALQFMNLPSLNLVNLAGNQITSIHHQTFLNVPNLKFIYMADNAIRDLLPGQFQPFRSLELLDLSRNQIQRVPSESFANLPRLSQVYLSGNQIVEIQPNAFANSSIIILLLSENNLFHITGETFAGLGYLQQLSLKNNKIALVAQNAFHQLPSLVVLDLSHNKIINLEPSTFLAQLNLFLLDLSHNELSTVPYNAFNQRIATVILQENPLVCSERVHLIQNGVGIFVPGTNDEVCGGSTNTANLAPGTNIANDTIANLIPSGPLIPENTQLAGVPPDSPSFVQAKPAQPLAPARPIPNVNAAFTDHPPVIVTFTTPGPTFGQRPFGGTQTGTGNSGASLSGSRLTPVQPQLPNNEPEWKGPIYYPNVPYSGNTRVPSSNDAQIPTNPLTLAETPPNQPNQPSILQVQPTRPAPSNSANSSYTLSFAEGNSIGAIGPNFGNFPPQPPVSNTAGPNRTWPGFSSEAELPTSFSSGDNENLGPQFPPPSNPTNPTLPPGVILATNTHPRANETGPSNDIIRTHSPKEPKPTSPWGPDARGGSNIPGGGGKEKSDMTASTVIAVALTVVIVVLLVVFVTLCVVRHRNRAERLQGSSGSTDESRTSAYVAAQAARLNYNAIGTQNGTFTPGHAPPIPHARVAGPGQNQRTGALSNNGAWLYTPSVGGTYSTYYGTRK